MYLEATNARGAQAVTHLLSQADKHLVLTALKFLRQVSAFAQRLCNIMRIIPYVTPSICLGLCYRTLLSEFVRLLRSASAISGVLYHRLHLISAFDFVAVLRSSRLLGFCAAPCACTAYVYIYVLHIHKHTHIHTVRGGGRSVLQPIYCQEGPV